MNEKENSYWQAINRMWMDPLLSPLSYPGLVELAEKLINECGEDVGALCEKMDGLSGAIRDELLVSDRFNAFQTFYYFFRTFPDDIRMERLVLQPASALHDGVLIDEIDLLELIFAVVDDEAVMVVSDGEHALATFLGTDAYRDALMYIHSTL
jgi:hypothetical protein